jgi:mRNA-degrading endonuclease RelE of RelBE toxin-antitoxin system
VYKLKIIPRAQKDLDAFRGKTFEKIKKKILCLSNQPRPFGAIKLTQEENLI